MLKQFYYQAILFSIRKQFISIWTIDGTLSGATTPNQSGPGSDGNEGALCISQISSITRNLTIRLFFSYPGYSLVGILPLLRCSQCILQPHRTD